MMGARTAGTGGPPKRRPFKELVEQRIMREVNALQVLDVYRAALQEQQAQYSIDNNSAESVAAMIDDDNAADPDASVDDRCGRGGGENDWQIGRTNKLIVVNQRVDAVTQRSYLPTPLAAQPSAITATDSSSSSRMMAKSPSPSGDSNDRALLLSPSSSKLNRRISKARHHQGDDDAMVLSMNLMDRFQRSTKFALVKRPSDDDHDNNSDGSTGREPAVSEASSMAGEAEDAAMNVVGRVGIPTTEILPRHHHDDTEETASSMNLDHCDGDAAVWKRGAPAHSVSFRPPKLMVKDTAAPDPSKSVESSGKAQFGKDNEMLLAADSHHVDEIQHSKDDERRDLDVHHTMNCGQRIFFNINNFRKACGAFVNHEKVQFFMIMLIVVNAIMMGIGTFDFVDNNYVVSRAFEISDAVFLITFTVELSFQFVYRGLGVFLDGWLFFDVFIVVVSWSLENFQVVRAFRIFRAFRLVTRMHVLKNLVSALFAVAPSMSAIISLLMLIIYIYSVLCTVLFQDLYEEGYLDVDYFGTLNASIFTLFQMMTLDWSDIARQVMVKYSYAWGIFTSFLIITSFILYSLIIAVVCDAVKVTEHFAEDEAHMDGQLNNTERIAKLQKRVYELGNAQARILQSLNEAMVMLHETTIDFDNDDNMDVDDSDTDGKNTSTTDQATKSSKNSLLGFLS